MEGSGTDSDWIAYGELRVLAKNRDNACRHAELAFHDWRGGEMIRGAVFCSASPAAQAQRESEA